MGENPEKHDAFKIPSNKDIKIWRYMDFSKFISMLEGEALFFSRSDLLGDPFEGAYPALNIEYRKQLGKECGMPTDKAEELIQHLTDTNIKWRNWVYINCWHENSHESAALWAQYTSSKESIAVQSTYNLLRKSLDTSKGTEKTIYIGEIEYLDYSQEFIPEGNMLNPFLRKRKSFEHEKEIRAIFVEFPIVNKKLRLDLKPEVGKNIKINLKDLVESIYVSPGSPQWFRELIEKVVKRYGFKFPVRQSSMDSSPLF